MMNKRLIAEAIKIAINYLEAENIYESTAILRKRAEKWYSMTEIVSPQTLAAVVISGDFIPGITWNEIEDIEYFYFPIEPIEHGCFHINEIEEAMRMEGRM